MSDTNLARFRSVVGSALVQLEARREEVNDLNVFPVADGDTGDNMALTLRAVLDELDRLAGEGHRTIDDIGREEIVESVAGAALLGARGNSGVILSQLIRGAAEELVSRPGELIDPVLVGAALARAADRAYASVRDPAEGTILTVVREMAHRVASELAHMPTPRLDADAGSGDQDAAIAEILERAVEAGQQSVRRGPELLAVLRDAGVVDAGGHGLTVIFAGIVAALRGADPPPLDHHAPARVSHPQHNSETHRYCVNFAVMGAGLNARDHVAALEDIGDSVLVVGEGTTLKVHVHTDEPGQATSIFDPVGQVSHLDVADMTEQVARRAARLLRRESDGGEVQEPVSGALAVVDGAGMRALFEGLGVDTLDGGPTLNPSTYDLLAAVHAVPAESVMVLPNSPNVIMAAERAAELSDKQVRVIPTRSPQAGLAAAVALDPGGTLAVNAAAMEAAVRHLRTGAVARAARDDASGRFRSGEAVGFVEEEIVAWGTPDAALGAVLARLSQDAELVTCIAGEGPPLDGAAVAELVPEGVELEQERGGQSAWWWLVGAE